MREGSQAVLVALVDKLVGIADVDGREAFVVLVRRHNSRPCREVETYAGISSCQDTLINNVL